MWKVSTICRSFCQLETLDFPHLCWYKHGLLENPLFSSVISRCNVHNSFRISMDSPSFHKFYTNHIHQYLIQDDLRLFAGVHLKRGLPLVIPLFRGEFPVSKNPPAFWGYPHGEPPRLWSLSDPGRGSLEIPRSRRRPGGTAPRPPPRPGDDDELRGLVGKQLGYNMM